MAKISSYPSDANVTTSDRLIGSDNENSNETKNFEVGDIINLAQTVISGNFVPYTGATGNVDLGSYALTSSLVSVNGVVPNGGGIYLGNIINDASGIYAPDGQTTSIGDPFFNQNGTVITLNDTLQKITFVGGFDIDNGQGTAGQVLTSQGSGATPEWTSLSASYVPYTGATANVDLGSYSLTADVGTFQTTLNLNGDLRVNGSPGNLGEIFVSGGVGTYPTWQPISTVIELPYLSAYSALQQTATLANTAYAMKFNTVDISNNISISNDGLGNPTRIGPTESGVYNIQFSAQLQRSSGGSSATVDIWFRQGGVNIPNSNTSVNVQANAGFLVAAWNFYTFIDVDGIGPYVEIMWATTDTAVSLQQAASNALHPATPSVILTVNKVSA